jgi:hypothetical protein
MPSWHPVFSKNEICFALQAMLRVVVAQVLCFRPVFLGLPPPDENVLPLQFVFQRRATSIL